MWLVWLVMGLIFVQAKADVNLPEVRHSLDDPVEDESNEPVERLHMNIGSQDARDAVVLSRKPKARFPPYYYPPDQHLSEPVARFQINSGPQNIRDAALSKNPKSQFPPHYYPLDQQINERVAQAAYYYPQHFDQQSDEPASRRAMLPPYYSPQDQFLNDPAVQFKYVVGGQENEDAVFGVNSARKSGFPPYYPPQSLNDPNNQIRDYQIYSRHGKKKYAPDGQLPQKYYQNHPQNSYDGFLPPDRANMDLLDSHDNSFPPLSEFLNAVRDNQVFQSCLSIIKEILYMFTLPLQIVKKLMENLHPNSPLTNALASSGFSSAAAPAAESSEREHSLRGAPPQLPSPSSTSLPIMTTQADNKLKQATKVNA